jgi:hypothetical protein
MACLRVHFDMVFFLGFKSVPALMLPAGLVIAAASIRISHLVLHDRDPKTEADVKVHLRT